MKNFLKQILGQSKANRKIMAIEELATERGTTGGLAKRIDENRELLELLQERVPQFVSSHPWLVGWIKANDEFFTQLEGILENRKVLYMSNMNKVPRPWPFSDFHANSSSVAVEENNSLVDKKYNWIRLFAGILLIIFVLFLTITFWYGIFSGTSMLLRGLMRSVSCSMTNVL